MKFRVLLLVMTFVSLNTLAGVVQVRAALLIGESNIQKGKIVTLAAKPSWLLMPDEAKQCGDTVRIGGSLSVPGSEFEFKGYESAEPLTIQWCPDDRIAWVKGRGEITNLRTGERVVLPLQEAAAAALSTSDPFAGTTVDSRTGLRWQQVDSKSKMKWDAAVKYCSDLKLGGLTWRLPTYQELLSIAESAGGKAVSKRTLPWTWTPLAGGAQLMLEGATPNPQPLSWSGLFYWTSDEYSAKGTEHALVVFFAKDNRTWLLGEAKDPASVGRSESEHLARCIVGIARREGEQAYSPEGASGGKAVVYVYRLQKFAFKNRPIVRVNDEDVALLATGRYVSTVVEPGEIKVAAGYALPTKLTIETLEEFHGGPRLVLSDVTFTATAGESYFVLGEIVWGPKPKLTLVPAAEATQHIRDLRAMHCDFAILELALEELRDLQTVHSGRLKAAQREKAVCPDL